MIPILSLQILRPLLLFSQDRACRGAGVQSLIQMDDPDTAAQMAALKATGKNTSFARRLSGPAGAGVRAASVSRDREQTLNRYD